MAVTPTASVAGQTPVWTPLTTPLHPLTRAPSVELFLTPQSSPQPSPSPSPPPSPPPRPRLLDDSVIAAVDGDAAALDRTPVVAAALPSSSAPEESAWLVTAEVAPTVRVLLALLGALADLQTLCGDADTAGNLASMMAVAAPGLRAHLRFTVAAVALGVECGLCLFVSLLVNALLFRQQDAADAGGDGGSGAQPRLYRGHQTGVHRPRAR